jgi:hypothetical protein
MQAIKDVILRAVVGFGLSLATVALILVGCGRTPGAPKVSVKLRTASSRQTARPPVALPKQQIGSAPQMDITQKGVSLRWVENGQLRMTARATFLTGNEVTRRGTLSNFSGELYENGKLTAAIRAPMVEVDEAKRIIIASGGVSLKSLERKTKVRAKWIKWYEKDQRVVGNGGVKIESTMGTLEGAAFVADTGLKSIKVFDLAKGLWDKR